MREYLYIIDLDNPSLVTKVTKSSIENNPNWKYYTYTNSWVENTGSTRTAHESEAKAIVCGSEDIIRRIASEEGEAKTIIDKIVESRLIQIALDKRLGEITKSKNGKK